MKKVIYISLFIFLISLIPVPTEVVPEWMIRVVDENGTPYKKRLIKQSCKNYTLGINPCAVYDASQYTDENGYVIFPKRIIWCGVLSRSVRSIYHILMWPAEGSLGTKIYIEATGGPGYPQLKYESGHPLPETFVIQSEVAQ